MLKGTTINDSIHGMITLSAYERSVIYTPEYFRLHDVHQSSTLYMTYPTNRTMRYEHSIGTMKLCSDMYFHSILNAEQDVLSDFFACAKKYLQGVLDKINQNTELLETYLNCIPIEPLDQLCTRFIYNSTRYSFIPSNVSEGDRLVQVLLMETIRTGALLHDIGHPPFSHIIEHSIEKSYSEVKKIPESERTSRQSVFLEDMKEYFSPTTGAGEIKPLHEKMGDTISENLLTNVVELYCREEDGKQFRIETIFALIIRECVFSMFQEAPFFTQLHRIIDSSVDGDRLDYVTRDVKNSGIDSGVIDYPRIIHGMKLIKLEDDSFIFAFSEKSMNTLEDFLKRRFVLYKDIDFHHHAIKTDFLLEHTVKCLILDYLAANKEEAAGAEKNQLIPFDISGIWYPLTVDQVKLTKKSASNLLQWNDSWLMTVLKQLFYSVYIFDEDKTITRQLNEFLCNGKEYFSMTKRITDFKLIDQTVQSELQNFGVASEYTGFAIRDLLSRLEEFDCTMQEFKELVNDAAFACAGQVYGENAIQDIILAWPRIKTGTKQTVYLHKDNQISIFQEESSIVDILELQIKYIPPFYIYMMFRNDFRYQGEDSERKEEFLNLFGKTIIDKLLRRL